MNSRFALGAAVMVLALALFGCGKTDGEKKDAAAARPATAVEAVALAPSETVEGIDIVGALTPKYNTIVKSEYQGVITKVFVTEWVHVKKGDLLAELDTRETSVQVEAVRAQVGTADAQESAARAQTLAAKASLIQAEAGLSRAKREYDRLLGLKDAGLVTQQSLDDARTALEVAQSQVEAAKAGVEAAKAQVESAKSGVKAQEKSLAHAETRLSKFLIKSPMNGVVAYRGVSPGDLVGDPASPKVMFQIVDDSLLELTVSVPSNNLGDLAPGQTIVFTADAYPGRDFTATVRFINPTVTESDRSVKVMADIDNRAGLLKGGLFVKGKIITSRKTGVLLVPRLAFLSLDLAAKTGDLLIAENQVARRKTVSVGAAYGDTVEVASGLEAGALVITRGGYHVKDGDRISLSTQPGDK